MKSEIRLSKESVFKLRFQHFLKELGKGIYKLLKPFVWILKKLGALAFQGWNLLYERLYSQREYLTKVGLKIIALVEAVLLVIFLVRYFWNHTFLIEIIRWGAGVLVGFGGLILILCGYHVFIGRDFLYQQYELLTEKYVEVGLPQNIKYVGPRRAGKDTTSISFTSIIVRMFKRQMEESMRRIRKICYIFDFGKVHNACYLFDRYFYQPSRKKREAAFLWICNIVEIQAFLTDRALKEINYQALIEDYKASLNNKVNYKSKYMFHDGVSNYHFLGLLQEYMFMFVRLYIVKNLTITNQPYVEDVETGLMSKVYSVYFEAIRSNPDVVKPLALPNGKTEIVVYQEKIEAPLLEWTVVNITEGDTWFNNLDSDVKKMIKEQGLRDEKAYLFHNFKKMYYFQQCHDAERTNKQLRELDAFYMTIIQRTELPGASKRNAVLSFIQKRIDSYLDRKEAKYDSETNRLIYKNQKRLDYLERLYRASMNEKYLAKIERIKASERKPQGKIYTKLSAFNTYLTERIAWNEKEHGLIRITATISDQPTTPNLKEISLRDLVNRNRPLYHESYKVDFYFKMKDSMGRYNPNYMSDIFENRAIQSRLDMMHVINWDRRMELNRDIMLYMGFPAGHKMYGITPEEVFDFRYVEASGEEKKQGIPAK